MYWKSVRESARKGIGNVPDGIVLFETLIETGIFKAGLNELRDPKRQGIDLRSRRTKGLGTQIAANSPFPPNNCVTHTNRVYYHLLATRNPQLSARTRRGYGVQCDACEPRER